MSRPSETKDKVNILLVDDQPGKLLSYRAILEELGENLVSALNGREALEHLLKGDFAVILVDVCMPEQDGFELVETIRTHHRFSKTAIIFVSAIQLTDPDKIKGYASGAVDYVSVPIVPEILRAKVSVFVDLYRKTSQLEHLNQQLEQRVLERTAELFESQEALRDTNTRKDVFLATLAHELRNPLAPMQNAIELLRRGGSQRETLDLAVTILARQLSQMSRLVEDLLDLNRVTRNNLELRKESVDLATVLTGAVETSRPYIDRAKQRLRLSVPTTPMPMYADLARLMQVVSNLLNNASKYTPDGGEITLSATSSESETVIRVKDTGIGIGAEELSHLFEPFFQVRDSKEQPNSGLGLGLSLARRIVELHGGTVDAFSDGHGQGSEFVIRLPHTETSEPTSCEPTSTALGEHRQRRVLVVDDNADAASSLGLLLETQGHTVELADNGQTAVVKVQKFQPDLVIMDIGMPVMDGYEAARTLRANGSKVTLVAMTGWGQKEDVERAMDAGFDHHVVKPVPLAALERLLSETQAEG